MPTAWGTDHTIHLLQTTPFIYLMIQITFPGNNERIFSARGKLIFVAKPKSISMYLIPKFRRTTFSSSAFIVSKMTRAFYNKRSDNGYVKFIYLQDNVIKLFYRKSVWPQSRVLFPQCTTLKVN